MDLARTRPSSRIPGTISTAAATVSRAALHDVAADRRLSVGTDASKRIPVSEDGFDDSVPRAYLASVAVNVVADTIDVLLSVTQTTSPRDG